MRDSTPLSLENYSVTKLFLSVHGEEERNELIDRQTEGQEKAYSLKAIVTVTEVEGSADLYPRLSF
jgi:hypothetical protein